MTQPTGFDHESTLRGPLPKTLVRHRTRAAGAERSAERTVRFPGPRFTGMFLKTVQPVVPTQPGMSAKARR